jgi:uncharacterized protein (TIGR03905 family)
MQQSFKVSNVCTNQIDIELDGDKVKEVDFHKGCPGNLIGISKLVQGKTAEEVIELLEGIKCGSKDTSCPDQLAKSLKSMVRETCSVC